MSVILKGVLTKLELGLSSGTNADVTNLIYMRWVRQHDIVGSFVSAQKTPDHWTQKHSWIAFEIGILGYNTAFTSEVIQAADAAARAYDEDGDSGMMDYFCIFYATKAGVAKSTSFTGAIIATMELMLRDTEDPITVVRGLAYYKTDA